MVLSLPFDVCLHPRRLTFAEGESAVSALPLKELIWSDLVGHEMRRRPFDLFRKLGHSNRSVQSNQQVHVIGNAADRQWDALEFATFFSNRRIKPWFDLLGYKGQAIPGSPYDVEIKLCVW